jgi:hypothetical protein
LEEIEAQTRRVDEQALLNFDRHGSLPVQIALPIRVYANMFDFMHTCIYAKSVKKGALGYAHPKRVLFNSSAIEYVKACMKRLHLFLSHEHVLQMLYRWGGKNASAISRISTLYEPSIAFVRAPNSATAMIQSMHGAQICCRNVELQHWATSKRGSE